MPRIALVIIFCFIVIQLPISAQAAVTSCSASVSPNSVEISETNDFTFTLNNTDSVTYNWIKITRPSATHYSINSGSATGWSATANTNEVTFTGSNLAASGSISITVNANTGSFASDSTAWTVAVSDDGGSSTFSCSGSLGTSITVPSDVQPSISAISVFDITDSAVTLSWTTNKAANSVVEYGADEDYGSTGSDSVQTTSHTITLTGLSSNTTYHYNLKSTDSGGLTGQSGDNTFVTAKTGTNTTTTTTVTTTVTVIATPTPTPKPELDTAKPQIIIETDLTKPFTESPQITGRIVDDKEVVSAEYSIDDGKNWLPVDVIPAKAGIYKNGSPIKSGMTVVNFEFIPAIFEDGNYKIRVRAEDPSGNVGESKIQTLVIDRLPPQVVAGLFSLGPQVILPNRGESISVIQGLDTKITLSLVGGPITIDLYSENLNLTTHLAEASAKRADRQIYSLVKNIDNGLWSGTLSFQTPGIYDLNARLVDGAGNITERVIGRVTVLEGGQIFNKNGKNIAGAEVSLYYFEPTSGQFIIWDGNPFSQQNPQKTSKDGNFQLFVPPGKYFLQVSALGFKTVRTNIFTLNKNTPLTARLMMEPSVTGLPIFNLLNTEREVHLDLNQESLESEASSSAAISKEMPYFSFEEITTNTFKGKPTILTFMTTWSPQTFEQLPDLDSLTETEVNRAVIMEGESPSKVGLFKKRGGYKLPILADRDATLAQPLGILTLPTHVFLDRKGIIRKIKVGVLSKNELMENLVN